MAAYDFGLPVAGCAPERATTYLLDIEIDRDTVLEVGRLGRCRFVAGRYTYTGSARRNLLARIRRHLRSSKTLHWHIDYLLSARNVKIVGIRLSDIGECDLNQSVKGTIPVSGFGSSDCRAGCGSHLKYRGGNL
jgi:Uri superfamily endonuclease